MTYINVDEILSGLDECWASEMDTVSDALHNAIQDDVYTWDRITIRSNGSTVGSPRNIVDRKFLLNSQYRLKISSEEEEFGWTAEHAAINYYGILRSDGTMRPARKWDQHALRGDSTADMEYQQPTALLNVVEDFSIRAIAFFGD
jgi:hypothetical protein